jgi:hypothetical protein
VDPVDDVRVSNPPSNPELLAALAEKLVGIQVRHAQAGPGHLHLHDLPAQFTKVNETNAGDTQATSPAQPSAGSVLRCSWTPSPRSPRPPTSSKGLPLGARAVQIADGAVSATYFLTTFGRAKRESVCSCEVKMEPTLSQALHLMNGDAVQRPHQARAAWWPSSLTAKKTDREIVEDLYFRVFGRAPLDREWESIHQTLAASADQRQQALEDVFWALMNSKEFYFNH